ncbi:MAG: metal ABC transporter ATP-binding protein [Oscillospiraceae bacterium]|jgi:zinc transport system ATP-binding protein|nr:metal ABC transporter ATP-binding protein [Oscillospiraceae bacterium]
MIIANNIYYTYTGAPPYILAGLNLEIKAGEYVSVIGDNGSGKSTLMRLLLGLLKPAQGTVISKAKRVGYVPQRGDFANSGFPITVYEMLRAYSRLLGVRDRRAIDRSLDLTGTRDLKNKLVGTLSGGQGQKVTIARALIGEPELLILDEPSTGIDVPSQAEIYGILRDLNRAHGLTIVSVEHNLQAALDSSTLIYHLHAGHGHICTPKQFIDEYLGGKA